MLRGRAVIDVIDNIISKLELIGRGNTRSLITYIFRSFFKEISFFLIGFVFLLPSINFIGKKLSKNNNKYVVYVLCMCYLENIKTNISLFLFIVSRGAHYDKECQCTMYT